MPVAAVVLLAVEAEIATHGHDLPERAPYDLDGTVGTDTGAPLRIVWLGDSTAAGVGASGPDHALPRLVAASVAAARHRPVALRSFAVSGARIADVLHQQVAQVPTDTDLVVIDVGSNDVTHLTSRGTFRSRYRQVLARLPPRARVVLLGVPDMGAPPRFLQPLRFLAGVRGGTLDAVIHHLAVAGHDGYVDIAGRTGPSFRRLPRRFIAADHYHPTDAGYRLWADATEPVVFDALRGR